MFAATVQSHLSTFDLLCVHVSARRGVTDGASHVPLAVRERRLRAVRADVLRRSDSGHVARLFSLSSRVGACVRADCPTQQVPLFVPSVNSSSGGGGGVHFAYSCGGLFEKRVYTRMYRKYTGRQEFCVCACVRVRAQVHVASGSAATHLVCTARGGDSNVSNSAWIRSTIRELLRPKDSRATGECVRPFVPQHLAVPTHRLATFSGRANESKKGEERVQEERRKDEMKQRMKEERKEAMKEVGNEGRKGERTDERKVNNTDKRRSSYGTLSPVNRSNRYTKQVCVHSIVNLHIHRYRLAGRQARTESEIIVLY
jgi:hypothetical protein